MSNRLNTLQNKPLRERVVETLRDAILTGELKPGEALVETDLAAQLGISRAPLREALQQLSAEGLIETIAYHGSRVKELTRKDVEELYSLRTMYETFAARRIIQNGSADAAKRLHDIYEQMLDASNAGDIRLLNMIDRSFHDAIIELSDHSLLRFSWSHVSLRVRQVMALSNRRMTSMNIIAQNHLRIAEAIASGDVDLSVRLLEEHIASAGDLIASQWDKRSTDQTPS
ncbi:GntR family transcriptional regulator [Aggregatilineales bacterium SYSU G02658]